MFGPPTTAMTFADDPEKPACWWTDVLHTPVHLAGAGDGDGDSGYAWLTLALSPAPEAGGSWRAGRSPTSERPGVITRRLPLIVS
ncbi:hypothetical protein MXD63_21250 [Frankia sp. Cpl3]|uniref:hypothetical protein n=1 Tax=Parafrankia colletiae TaxID=573497 RepID=UPI0018E389D4|nr:hypothetical protein [Parafrankia colletiae]MCK9902585.1 hypothetical protein [Frankia sp. Cpl3]